MCMRCDGYSWEEIDRHTDLVIRVNGFITIEVEGPRSWSYTIGANESWDQPDLVVVGVEPSLQRILIHALAEDYAVHGEIRDERTGLLPSSSSPSTNPTSNAASSPSGNSATR